MLIRICLPAGYERLQDIKKDNYPYRKLFQAYMRAIARLAKRENLTLFSVFGRVEHALAKDTPLELSMTGGAPATLNYKEDDPEVIAFYKDSPLNQTKTTLMFVRTLMRLTAKYGNSIPELVYLIDTLPATVNQQMAPVSSPTTAVITLPTASARPKAAPVVNQQIDPAVPEVPAAKPDAATTKPIDPATMVHIKKRPGKAAMTDAANRAHKVAAKITAKTSATSVAASSATTSAAVTSTEPVKDVDDVLARAERLKQEVDSGDSKAAEGEKVATNPLLSDFF